MVCLPLQIEQLPLKSLLRNSNVEVKKQRCRLRICLFPLIAVLKAEQIAIVGTAPAFTCHLHEKVKQEMEEG
jgi:hypothetical protein